MSNYCPDHYSHNFILKLNRLPAKATDRFSRTLLLIGFIFGTLLCLLGSYHFLSAYISGTADFERNLPTPRGSLHSFVSPDLFNAIIILVGLGIIVACLIHFVRYKKILFDGSSLTVKNRPLFGQSYSFTEPLYNYIGVRMRVKFYQYGIFTKNKFIIELYHKDPAKIVPLYISTSGEKIRTLWQNYAQALRMPGITISDKGMVSHNFKDMSRPYKNVIESWHLPADFIFRMQKPDHISFKSRRTGEKMIKICKLFFDAYSILSLFAIILAGSLLGYAALSHQILRDHLPLAAVLLFYTVLLTIIIYSLLDLTSKDILIITHDKIFVFRKIWFLRMRDGVTDIKDIKGIDINYTPVTDRYYLTIVSDQNTLIVGNKLPVGMLRWIRAVLINEIIGN